jgi:hypothetical protein
MTPEEITIYKSLVEIQNIIENQESDIRDKYLHHLWIEAQSSMDTLIKDIGLRTVAEADFMQGDE